jgi:cytochrome c oxidase cbb3-type subunit 3
MPEVVEQQMTEDQQDAAAVSAAHAEHTYDGITEYDNPIPAWWAWMFGGSIVFAALYLVVSVMSGGQMSAVASYDRDVVADLKRQGGVLNADAPTLVRLLKDDDSLKAGAAVFQTNCVSCHNRDASGLIGPNLTDDAYIHVAKITDIADVVAKGRKNGAMPAWSNRLSPNEVVQVSAYVASLRGKNLPGKAAEGNVIPPWSAQ